MEQNKDNTSYLHERGDDRYCTYIEKLALWRSIAWRAWALRCPPPPACAAGSPQVSQASSPSTASAAAPSSPAGEWLVGVVIPGATSYQFRQELESLVC
jgi:hypothetical protein